MVAAFAAKGLNSGAVGLGSTFSECENDLSESGTTPSCPWNSLNVISKLGPSSKIGPLPVRTWQRLIKILAECSRAINQFQLSWSGSDCPSENCTIEMVMISD
jgi:hypothetical protein